MKKMNSALLILACLICGFGFYKMNDGDTWNSVFFAFGLSGIVLSVLRTKPKD